MRFKATHDALTSLWNRGMILDFLPLELSRASGNRGKQVNDNYGCRRAPSRRAG
jgi:GGDEF domain-containing protein